MLEPPPITRFGYFVILKAKLLFSTSLPMYPNAPPSALSTPLSRPFAIPGRCRPPIMMPLGMPKVHLGHIVPIGNAHYHRELKYLFIFLPSQKRVGSAVENGC